MLKVEVMNALKDIFEFVIRRNYAIDIALAYQNKDDEPIERIQFSPLLSVAEIELIRIGIPVIERHGDWTVSVFLDAILHRQFPDPDCIRYLLDIGLIPCLQTPLPCTENFPWASYIRKCGRAITPLSHNRPMTKDTGSSLTMEPLPHRSTMFEDENGNDLRITAFPTDFAQKWNVNPYRDPHHTPENAENSPWKPQRPPTPVPSRNLPFEVVEKNMSHNKVGKNTEVSKDGKELEEGEIDSDEMTGVTPSLNPFTSNQHMALTPVTRKATVFPSPRSILPPSRKMKSTVGHHKHIPKLTLKIPLSLYARTQQRYNGRWFRFRQLHREHPEWTRTKEEKKEREDLLCKGLSILLSHLSLKN
ncbi:hypothetical protein D9757_012398 [Collybiopsis confluens]|uniref:Uncharacterized protein n=1 Tax=Collybiopsis confluens TaxID=2823264 RepID=A0A8H5GJW2_9AGAR|nr:hypothetical protein D9757_012398 [Collybiopsis confluens]